MKRILSFIIQHKKSMTLVAVIAVFAAVSGVYFAAQPKSVVSAAENEQTAKQEEKTQPTATPSAAPSSAASAPSSADSQTKQQTAKTTKETSSKTTQTQKTDSGNTGSQTVDTADTAQTSGTTQKTESHTHNWQPHTTQIWIPSIVEVVDTPEQTIYGAQLYTDNGDGTWISNGETYWFENGFTIDDLKDIIYDKMLNEGYIGNYVNRTKTVPAVTHEEDQGHYEEQIDYYYCSCGAVK